MNLNLTAKVSKTPLKYVEKWDPGPYAATQDPGTYGRTLRWGSKVGP